MKRWVVFLMAALLLGGAVGCAQSDKDKAKNSGLDRPKPAGQ